MFRSEYQCPDCGGSDAYHSRRRSFSEKYVFPFVLMKPVRCANCFRRTIVSNFVRARDRPHRTIVKPQAVA